MAKVFLLQRALTQPNLKISPASFWVDAWKARCYILWRDKPRLGKMLTKRKKDTVGKI